MGPLAAGAGICACGRLSCLTTGKVGDMLLSSIKPALRRHQETDSRYLLRCVWQPSFAPSALDHCTRGGGQSACPGKHTAASHPCHPSKELARGDLHPVPDVIKRQTRCICCTVSGIPIAAKETTPVRCLPGWTAEASHQVACRLLLTGDLISAQVCDRSSDRSSQEQ